MAGIDVFFTVKTRFLEIVLKNLHTAVFIYYTLLTTEELLQKGIIAVFGYFWGQEFEKNSFEERLYTD